MKIKLTTPMERIEPMKAVISIDPPPSLASESVEMNENIRLTMQTVDDVAIMAEIESLNPKDAKNFKHYCLVFKPLVLPKGCQKWYAEATAEAKICWLYLRWKAQSNLMFLSGYVDMRPLTDDEFDRCVHKVICDETITDVREIPATLLGFPLNSRMVQQVQHALTHSPKLAELFPERLKFFVEAGE